MVTLRPFVGLVPSSEAAARTVAGSERGAARLARRASHPRHVAWLESGDNDRPAALAEWLADGSLTVDEVPRLRLLVQRLPDGHEVVGLIGLARLSDLVPHEGTDPAAVRRRLARDARQEVDSRPLLAVLPADPPGLQDVLRELRSQPPQLDLVDEDGMRHTMFTVPPPVAEQLTSDILSLPCLLADGHHRVAAAAAAGRAEIPAFVTFAAHAPRLLPVWRIAAVPRAARTEVERWMDGLDEQGEIRVRFQGRERRASCAEGELQIEASQRLAESVPQCQRIVSTADLESVVVSESDGAVVVGSAPPTVTEVLEAVASGRPLPPKSTAFHPKPRVGLIMHRVPTS